MLLEFGKHTVTELPSDKWLGEPRNHSDVLSAESVSRFESRADISVSRFGRLGVQSGGRFVGIFYCEIFWSSGMVIEYQCI